jgi:MFS transporter, SP family, sugar:H+ symporter
MSQLAFSSLHWSTMVHQSTLLIFSYSMIINPCACNIKTLYRNRFHPWGWRLSLGAAGVPAFVLTLGALVVDDTPTSLIERGRLEEGKAVLKKLCGTDNIESELKEIVEATHVAQQVRHPFRELLQRHNRPPLVIAIFLQVYNNLLFTIFHSYLSYLFCQL